MSEVGLNTNALTSLLTGEAASSTFPARLSQLSPLHSNLTSRQ